MKNIEIKARYPDQEHARSVAAALGARKVGLLRQLDTFYRVEGGRLKLREPGEGSAELIFYQRPDLPGPRPSEYEIAPVTDPARMRGLLERALGVWVQVRKKRELWLLDNVRIHLDQVEGLGLFLELEAVVDSAHPEPACRAAVRHLLEEFGIGEVDLLSDSYADQLAQGR